VHASRNARIAPAENPRDFEDGGRRHAIPATLDKDGNRKRFDRASESARFRACLAEALDDSKERGSPPSRLCRFGETSRRSAPEFIAREGGWLLRLDSEPLAPSEARCRASRWTA
jgi:hypothetical protein